MKRTNKKGFTIVELVIVIAVIAILAAVLIPNISRLVRKAQVSNDLSLVRNLNLALETESATMDYPTAYDAFAAVKENGYDIAKIEAKASNNKILYDEVNKCFVYLNGVNLEYYPNSKKGDKATPNHQLWTVVTSAEDAKKSQYSVYWNGGDGATVEVTNVGFDVGENKNVTVTVKAGTQELTVRTNGGNMTIDSNGTVNHYGMIETADLQKVASESYHEFGYVTSYIKVTSGRIVVEPKASVSIIAVAGNGVSVEQKAGSELFKVAPTKSGISLENVKVLSEKTVVKTALENLENLRYGGGDGKKDETAFELYTAAHLVAFAKDVNEGKLTEYVYAKLYADVDISGMGWEPIGNAEHPFNGTFDGQNNTVKGLTNKGYTPAEKLWGISTNAKNRGTAYGFFGVVGDVTKKASYAAITIQNIKFENVDISISNSNMLGIAVGADIKAAKIGDTKVNPSYNGDITIQNITTTGSLICTNGSTVGGIAGKFETMGTLTLSKCENGAALTLSNEDGTDIKAGGILGFTQNQKNGESEGWVKIVSCESNGAITVNATGQIYIGGMTSFKQANGDCKNFEVSGSVAATINVTCSQSTGKCVYVAQVYGAGLTNSTVIGYVSAVNTDKASCMLNGTAVTVKYVGQK